MRHPDNRKIRRTIEYAIVDFCFLKAIDMVISLYLRVRMFFDLLVLSCYETHFVQVLFLMWNFHLLLAAASNFFGALE